MKIKSFSVVFAVLFLTMMILPLTAPQSAASEYGSADNPIIINNLTELNDIRNNLSAHYRLGNDIDASATSGWNNGTGWIPIGGASPYFTGSLDGDGYSIFGLFHNSTGSRIGMFGFNYGVISNLSLVDLNFHGSTNVGGIAGQSHGDIHQSSVTGIIDSLPSGQNVGGIAGVMYAPATITKSYSSAEVRAWTWAGGLVGYHLGGSIVQSYSTGSVSALGYIGGLVGQSTSTITECYSTGAVINGSSTNVGGFLGQSSGTVTKSYWDMQSSGQATSAGGSGVTGKTTVQMKQEATFTDWNFTGVWYINEGVSYPQLSAFVTVTGLSIETMPNLISYNYSDNLDLNGLTINISKSDGTYLLVDWDDSSLAIEPTNGTSLTHDNATVTVTHVASSKQTSFNITINETVTALTIEQQPQLLYNLGDSLNLSQMMVNMTRSNGNFSIIDFQDFAINDLVTDPSSIPFLNNSHHGSNVTVTHTPSGSIVYTGAIVINATASAGVDQNVDEGTVVTFDGSASASEMDVSNYTWVFSYNASTVELYGVSPTFNFSIAGNYTVTLTVKDIQNKTGTDTMMVNVTDINPIADSGADQTVNEGTVVIFNASGSYDVLGIRNYTWTFTYDGGTETLYGVSPTFNFSIPGNYTVILTVKDAANNTGTDTMMVNVSDLDPISDAGINQNVNEGTVVTFDGSNSYDVLGIRNYSWTFIYDGSPVTLYGVAPTHNFSIPGNYTVTLTVKDAANNTGTDTVMVNVTDLNPLANAGSGQTVNEGTVVTFNGSGSYDAFGIVNYSWTFTYDGETETLYGVSPTFNFSIPGNYTVTLTVKDVANNTGTDTMIVNVTDLNPVADAGVDQTVSEGTVVTFDGSASYDAKGISNYTWTFTYDGETETLYGVSPTFNFSIPGNYTVTLTVKDAANNTGTDTMIVNVTDLNPVADAGVDQTVDQGTTITFDGSGSYDSAGIDNYTWTFTYNGSIVTLYSASPTHNFSIPGNYTVTLIVKDAANNTGTDTMIVNVNDVVAPVANAGVDQTVNEGTVVTFNGSASTDNVAVTNYTWNFTYDGETETLYGVSPTFNFSIPGNYTVTLMVKDAANNTGTDTMMVNVTDLNPGANAGIDQTVNEGNVVIFDGSASYDVLGIRNYTWSFSYDGGAVILYGVSPTHNFSIPGNYTVTLTVKDVANNTGTDTMFVNVTDLNPLANAGIDQTVNEGSIVTFDGSASYDAFGIVNHTWNFTYDDGTITLYGVSPSFNFSIPGNYTVTLTVRDAANNTGTDTVMVNVSDLDPIADAGVDQTVDQATTVTFNGSGSYDSAGIDNYTWTFTYDGGTITLYGVSPTFVFEITGNYTVTLTVKDATQNSATDLMTVNVNDNTDPVVDAGLDQNVDKWTVVTFNGTDSTDNVEVTNYTWTFTYDGELVTLYGVSPTHNFSIPGNYTVTLTVKDSAENIGTDTMMVNVNDLWAPTIISSSPSIPVIGSFAAGLGFEHQVTVNESSTFTMDSDATFLNISINGTVSGTLQYGTYYVNISATSVEGKLVTWQNFTIIVVNGTWVNGTINGPDGNPLPGVEVWIDGVLVNITDEDGNFSLFLLDGDYEMEIVKDGFVTQTIGFQVLQDGDLEMDLVSLISDDDLNLVAIGALFLGFIVMVGVFYWLSRRNNED